ncbi:MAG: archemetzincin, partial [Gemmatimonadetes bacterium]|nr:archemetzincin [Gemmatimonadota bacterium]NIR80513.1 archemetzincin [Gemmatimonadota bacterium]NIT86247.1 archemetzincin [Gemmatimonadota bacterium]NIU33076.1 archemetzincin [Gemmatimonadota bacterium]NIU35026.1 archemetzincin [Gemmatimonadota bacterium]
FLPVFTFVFGEARLDGPAAVVSLHRLRPQAYGLPPDPPRLIARTLTEVVHELGHTFGLRHCTDFSCAMRASRAADEIDLKPPAYCRP